MPINPQILPTTPLGRTADTLAEVKRRVAVLERGSSGGAGGGSSTNFSDTPNIEFNVSGTVSADIPPTAAPTLARVGLGRAPSASSPLRVGDASSTYMEAYADSGLKRIDINRPIKMFATAGTMGTNTAIAFTALMDPAYTNALNQTSALSRMTMNLYSPQGTGTHGLRNRGVGNIRSVGTAVTGIGTNFASGSGVQQLVAGTSYLAIRASDHSTHLATVASITDNTHLTLAAPFAEDAAPGTISVTSGSPIVTGVGTDFLNDFQSNDVITTTTGVSKTVQSIQTPTQLTVTTNYSALASGVGYYLPFAINSNTINDDKSFNAWGGDGGTYWRGLTTDMTQNGYGSMEFLSIIGTLTDATSGGINEYGELSPFSTNITCNRLGGFMGPELGAITNPNKQGRVKNLAVHAGDYNLYSSYNTAYGPATNAWRDSGHIAFKIQSTAPGEPGSGIMITNRIGAGKPRRAFVLTHDWLENFSEGDQKFVMDFNGKIAVAGATSLNQSTNTAGFGSLGAIMLPGTNNVVTDGLWFGIDATRAEIYRIADGTIRIDDSLQVGGPTVSFGAVAVIGGTSATGFVSYSAITSGSPLGAVSTARVFSDLDGSSNERLRVQLGTGEIRTLAKKGGLDDFAVGATTALGGADAGIFLSSGGEINSVKGSGYIFKNYATAGHAEPRYAVTFSGEHRLGPGGSTPVDAGLVRDGVGSVGVTDGTTSGWGVLKAKAHWLMGTAGAGYVSFLEQSSPPGTPPATRSRLYTEDNGSGLQRLKIKWDNGTTSVIATQGDP